MMCFVDGPDITSGDTLSAARACAGPEIDDIVGGPDRIFVMLHYDHRVSQVPEMHQRLNEAVVVSLVQSNAWFVQDVKHPRKSRSDLGTESNTLGFSARKGSTFAIQSKIAETHLFEKSQAVPDLAKHFRRDDLLVFGEGNIFK